MRERRAIPVYSFTRVRSTNTKCTRGCGCNGHPAFPTPSLGGSFINASGAWRGEGANVCLDLSSLRANGSAEWPPDDRLQRATQYSEASVMESKNRGVPDTRWSLSSGSPKARSGGGV